MIILGLGLFAIWFAIEMPIVVAAAMIVGDGEINHGCG